MASNKIKRKFYYYDVEVLDLNDNAKKFKKQNEKLVDIFNEIKNMQEKIDGSKEKKKIKEQKKIEQIIDNGDKAYFIIDDVKDEKIKFRMVLCRKDALPYVEENGILSYLTEYLEGDFSLAEITHCIIYPKTGIMGAEYNHTGARASLLKYYIPEILKMNITINCTAKLDEEVFDKVINNKDYSLFQIGIKNDEKMKDAMQENMSIFVAPFFEIQDVDSYEIVLKRRKGKSKDGFNLPFDKDTMKKILSENKDGFKTFKVSQDSITADAVDLLKDKLVHEATLVKTKNKFIKKEDAYKAIDLFYKSKIE